MPTPNETIENKIKSFIVSVNGEGLTADILCKYPEDLKAVYSILLKIESQCNFNQLQLDKQFAESITIVNS